MASNQERINALLEKLALDSTTEKDVLLIEKKIEVLKAQEE